MREEQGIKERDSIVDCLTGSHRLRLALAGVMKADPKPMTTFANEIGIGIKTLQDFMRNSKRSIEFPTYCKIEDYVERKLKEHEEHMEIEKI